MTPREQVMPAPNSRDITFQGGRVDTQYVLPFGRPQEVVNKVKCRIDDLAPGDGFVFVPC